MCKNLPRLVKTPTAMKYLDMIIQIGDFKLLQPAFKVHSGFQHLQTLRQKMGLLVIDCVIK